jgi:cytochrome c-type biogenesis protein CcmH/NrfG
VKKTKRQRSSSPVEPKPAQSFLWWPWAAAPAALFVLFEVYGPATHGPFLLDDRSLPFMSPHLQNEPLYYWVLSARPLLMFTYWIDHTLSNLEPYGYHVTNLVLHFLAAIVLTLIVRRLMEIAPPSTLTIDQRLREALAVFAGGVFLLHPLQTESVAYVASRSETLSVLFYFSAYCVFLYKNPAESISIPRTLAVLVLFGAAVVSKEHTLTLPALILLTDLAWIRQGWRKNLLLYASLLGAGAIGGVFVLRILFRADTAGFSLQGLSPISYFATECRVVWDYVRLLLVPIGQNADPDIPLSSGFTDPWAIAGLLALVAAAASAWHYRKRWPLASLGVAVFLLLLAPTSSIVPIRDVLAERRVYLPMLGVVLIATEVLRAFPFRRVVLTGSAVLLVYCILTYQRAQLWGSPLTLWQDTAQKSPRKVRPRFQLAYARYESGDCKGASLDYDATSRLGVPDYTLLLDWGLALDCAGNPGAAMEKLRQAASLEPHNAHAYSLMGMVYGKQGRNEEALAALDQAQSVNPHFAMTYVYRGNITELSGNPRAAEELYRKALSFEPNNTAALEALNRVTAGHR